MVLRTMNKCRDTGYKEIGGKKGKRRRLTGFGLVPVASDASNTKTKIKINSVS